MDACVASEASHFASLPPELQELVVHSAVSQAQHDSRIFAKVALVNRFWARRAMVVLPDLPSLSLVNFRSSGIPHSISELSGVRKLAVIGSNVTCLPPSMSPIRDACLKYGLDVRSMSLEFLRGLQVLHVVKCDTISSLSMELRRLSCLSELHVKNCRNLGHIVVRLGTNLQSSLRHIHWDTPYLYYVPQDLGLCTNLESLTVGSSTMSRLPAGALLDLQKLRKLQLNLPLLRSLPDEFYDLESLEEFYLQSSQMVKLPRSLAAAGSNPCLQVLSLDCPNLAYIPPTFGCGSLKKLAVVCGIDQPMRVAWRFPGLENLELLCLTVGDKPLPASAATHLKSLKELRLMVFESCLATTVSDKLALQIAASIDKFVAGIPSLTAMSCLVQEPKAFPNAFRHSPSLKSLNVCFQNENGLLPGGSSKGGKGIARAWTEQAASCCDKLTQRRKAANKSFHGYSKLNRTSLLGPKSSILEVLRVSGSRNSGLPSTLPGLALLRQLSVDSMACSALPWDLGNLTNLGNLTLSNLALLYDLPASLSSLNNLTCLHIASCENLHSVPLSSSWMKLKALHISGCPKVRSLGASLQSFFGLRTLLLGCEQMLPAPPQLESLTALTSFTVTSSGHRTCEHTTGLPVSLGSLPSLRCIEASVECLGEVPASLSDLTALQSLNVKLGSKVLCVPNPECLRRIHPQQSSELLRKVEELSRLTVLSTSWLPTSSQSISNLEDLTLNRFPGLRLPNAIGQLQKLVCLEISDCKFLQSLPTEIAFLPRLLTLKLLGCRSLKRIAQAQDGDVAGHGTLGLPFPALKEVLCEACPVLQKPQGGRLGAVKLMVAGTAHAGVKRLRNGKAVTGG